MKFRNKSFQIAKILLLAGIVLSSCIGENFNFDNLDPNAKISPSYAIHFVHANISFEDIMPEDTSINQYLELNNDGYFDLYYQKDLYSLQAEDHIFIPDQTFPETLALSETELANFNTAYHVQVSRDFDYSFDAPEGMHLDSILFNQGRMTVHMESEWPIEIDIELKLSGFTKNGTDTLTFSILNLPETDYDTIVELTGYTVNLTNQETLFNTLIMNYVLTLDQEAGAVSQPTDQITVLVTLENIGFDATSGYFGNMSQTVSDNTFPLGFGGNTFDAEINFENPQFNIFYQNSFGLPIQFRFSSLYTLDANDQATNITIPPEMNPLILESPEPGEDFVYDTISINPSTLIQELLNFPKSLTFGGAVKLNEGIDPDTYYTNTLPGDGFFDISAEFRLPMSANFRFALRDTQDFPVLENLDQNIPLEQIEVKLGVNNGFPIDLGVQVFFADSINTVLDSLFDQFSIEGLKENLIEITISNEKIEKIKTAKNLIFEIVVKSTGFDLGQYVHITDQYEIAFDFSVKIDVDINPAEFENNEN